MTDFEEIARTIRGAKQHLRETDLSLLSERQLDAELRRAYGEVETVSPQALPNIYKGGNR